MPPIRKPFGICFSTRATLARSTSIDGNQQSSSVLSFDYITMPTPSTRVDFGC